MRYWRMSFKVGNKGHKMFSECRQLGVAAIMYDPLCEIDLSKHAKHQPKRLWDRLKPTQKASLSRVAYEMQAGDVIYAKEGPRIVAKGVVKGPNKKRAYKFDKQLSLLDPSRRPWAHQIHVDWLPEFSPIKVLLGGEQVTVMELLPERVRQIENVATIQKRRANQININSQTRLHCEEVYYRESPESRKAIIPRHKMLSNDFRTWLKNYHQIEAIQERQQVDVRFSLKKLTVLAELKICLGVGVTKSIREALGQLFEYNYYPSRSSVNMWLIVLDEKVSGDDLRFVEALRNECSLPLTIGWPEKKGFSFFPAWP